MQPRPSLTQACAYRSIGPGNGLCDLDRKVAATPAANTRPGLLSFILPPPESLRAWTFLGVSPRRLPDLCVFLFFFSSCAWRQTLLGCLFRPVPAERFFRLIWFIRPVHSPAIMRRAPDVPSFCSHGVSSQPPVKFFSLPVFVSHPTSPWANLSPHP